MFVNIVDQNTGILTVVFDGYLEKRTKDHIHEQRYPVTSMEMVISPVNKQNFID